jgi:hypothetical protein
MRVCCKTMGLRRRTKGVKQILNDYVFIVGFRRSTLTKRLNQVKHVGISIYIYSYRISTIDKLAVLSYVVDFVCRIRHKYDNQGWITIQIRSNPQCCARVSF